VNSISIRVAVFLVACTCFGVGIRAEDPPDLVEHVETVRKEGMTEAAREDLTVVASIRTGSLQLRFVEADGPGELTPVYGGTSCELPGTEHGRVARLGASLRKATLEDRDTLRAWADTDGSGFVSTAEAASFREIVELGYLAAWIVDRHGVSLDRIAAAAAVPPEEAEARIIRYNELAASLNALASGNREHEGELAREPSEGIPG